MHLNDAFDTKYGGKCRNRQKNIHRKEYFLDIVIEKMYNRSDYGAVQALLWQYKDEVKTMAQAFFGGVHPNDMKAATNEKAIEKLEAPAEVVIPLCTSVRLANPLLQWATR